MARLQATIDDEVMEILDQLLRRNDRGRFIELAIKNAIDNPAISNLFAWKSKRGSNDNIAQEDELISEKNISNTQKKKIQFDKEF